MNGSGQVIAVSVPAKRAGMRKESWWQFVVLAGLAIFVYNQVLIKLAQDWWNDPNFSHGFFVPLFSAFIVWRERKRLALIPLKPSWAGIVIITASLGLLIIGTLGAELFLARTSFVFLLAGAIVLYLGWAFFRAVLFPWAFLFLMIPIPAIIFNQITLPLQFLASELATWGLSGMGVPVLRQGNVIQLPVGPLEVAEACSGIRSLLSLGTVAIIYGYLGDTNFWRRAVLAVAAIPVAVLANAARIAGTGLVAQYWDPQKAEGFFHEFSGWVIFVISLTLLFLLHRILRWLSIHPKREGQ